MKYIGKERQRGISLIGLIVVAGLVCVVLGPRLGMK